MSDWKSETIALEYPIEVGAETITSATLREPNGRALRQIDSVRREYNLSDENADLPAGAVLDLIAALSDLSLEAVDELHPVDIAAIGEAIVPFFEAVAVPMSSAPRNGGGTTKPK